MRSCETAKSLAIARLFYLKTKLTGVFGSFAHSWASLIDRPVYICRGAGWILWVTERLDQRKLAGLAHRHLDHLAFF